jgi:hypothetical protein
VRKREGYDYDEVLASEILRPLDPTEHNMERLNRMGCGAGIVYQTARVRGVLERDAFEAAVAALARHGAVRARVVRGPEGALGFAESAGCRPQIAWMTSEDPANAWPPYVEADMNAGPVASHRGSAFRAFVFSAGHEHTITLAAPHHLLDGLSAVALMRELLEQIARPQRLPAMPLRAVESPFVAGCSDELRATYADLARSVAAWADSDPSARSRERGSLLVALEELETRLLHEGDRKVLPAVLLDVQRLIAQVARSCPEIEHVAADEDPGAPPERSGRVRTGRLVDTIRATVVTRLVASARERGITMHGVFGAAALFALAARNRALSGTPDGPRTLNIASPVNLRKQFHPPLADDDVRMAVDVALTPVLVAPGDGFWEIAARFSASVAREVERRRALGSWFRTERRRMEQPLSGVPVPLVSNIGRVAAEARYGDLELLELHGCMSTHSMFQIAMLIQTLRDAVGVCYYHELPTVSGASMRTLVDTVRALLERVAAGDAPIAGSS